MKVLLIGSGGREHALAWKISQSPLLKKLYCAPGNTGTMSCGENVQLEAADINGLVDFAAEKKIDLTIVGPELPLSLGIVDEFEEKGLKIFGPDKKAAELESSKVFAKQFMERHKIQTGRSLIAVDFPSIFANVSSASIKSLNARVFPKLKGAILSLISLLHSRNKYSQNRHP